MMDVYLNYNNIHTYGTSIKVQRQKEYLRT